MLVDDHRSVHRAPRGPLLSSRSTAQNKQTKFLGGLLTWSKSIEEIVEDRFSDLQRTNSGRKVLVNAK